MEVGLAVTALDSMTSCDSSHLKNHKTDTMNSYRSFLLTIIYNHCNVRKTFKTKNDEDKN
jgi:hypothetical protein